MDALQKAKAALKDYDQKGGTIHIDLANTQAAIAQAEQLQRIADLLENLSGAYTVASFGVLPPVAEGIINPEEHEPVGPSPLDNF